MWSCLFIIDHGDGCSNCKCLLPCDRPAFVCLDEAHAADLSFHSLNIAHVAARIGLAATEYLDLGDDSRYVDLHERGGLQGHLPAQGVAYFAFAGRAATAGQQRDDDECGGKFDMHDGFSWVVRVRDSMRLACTH